MGQFIFDKHAKIIIYGAATAGSRLVDRLEKMQIEVQGFIDKRAYEISDLKGYPVWAINEKELLQSIKDDTVIVIAVKNVFQHKFILKQLVKNTGCQKYIYLPVEEEKDSNLMKKAYDDLLYGKIEFPYTLETVEKVYINKFERADNRKVEGDEVIIHVPVGTVFSNYVEDKSSIWGDVPIMAHFPHIRLFQFFANEAKGRVDWYLDFCMKASENMQIVQSEAWKTNVLENRKDVYDRMLNEYELSKDFFSKNAPTAQWNEKGYFNLTSGKHRATFLVAKGERYLPLRISVEDEMKWINATYAETCFEKFEGADISEFEYTIDNPFFYRYKNNCGDFWNKILANVICDLSEYLYTLYNRVAFDKLQVLNLYEENRYLSRYLYKMGASVTDLYKENEVEERVDLLFHCEYKPHKNETRKEYDLLITKDFKKELLLERKIKYVVCQMFDACYEKNSKVIGTTITKDGIVKMYCLNFEEEA